MKAEHSVPFTYIDLFKYPSLRMTTICSIGLFFACNFLYNAPLMLADQLGFDFYLNGIIINCSQLATYFFSVACITHLPRRGVNITTSVVSLVTSFMLIFFQTNEICSQNCGNWLVLREMITLFILRFAVSLLYQILYLYVA